MCNEAEIINPTNKLALICLMWNKVNIGNWKNKLNLKTSLKQNVDASLTQVLIHLHDNKGKKNLFPTTNMLETNLW